MINFITGTIIISLVVSLTYWLGYWSLVLIHSRSSSDPGLSFSAGILTLLLIYLLAFIVFVFVGFAKAVGESINPILAKFFFSRNR